MNELQIEFDKSGNLSKTSSINHLSKLSRTEIFQYVSNYLYREYGITDAPLKHLIAILAVELETYELCRKEIENNGAIIFYNRGKTQGANPHLTTLQKSTKNILRIMKDLGMTPKSRLSSKQYPKPLNHDKLYGGTNG